MSTSDFDPPLIPGKEGLGNQPWTPPTPDALPPSEMRKPNGQQYRNHEWIVRLGDGRVFTRMDGDWIDSGGSVGGGDLLKPFVTAASEASQAAIEKAGEAIDAAEQAAADGAAIAGARSAVALSANAAESAKIAAEAAEQGAAVFATGAAAYKTKLTKAAAVADAGIPVGGEFYLATAAGAVLHTKGANEAATVPAGDLIIPGKPIVDGAVATAEAASTSASESRTRLDLQAEALDGEFVTSEDADVDAQFVSDDGGVLHGRVGDKIYTAMTTVGPGVVATHLAAFPSSGNRYDYIGDETVDVEVAFQDGGVAKGTDLTTGLPIIAGLAIVVQAIVLGMLGAIGRLALPSGTPVRALRNAVILIGQSFCNGAEGQPPKSTTPIYNLRTFEAGTKATLAGSIANGTNPGMLTDKRLIEDALTPDGTAGRGETPCFGTGKALVERGVQRGVIWADDLWFLSTAGKGGASITALRKGQPWYQQMIDQVTRGKAIAVAAGQSYAVQLMPILLGQTDALNGMNEATYTAQVKGWVDEITADVMAITGQASPPQFPMAQTCHATIANRGVALAQLRLAGEHDQIHLIGPDHPYPHAADGLHLTNVGYRLMGEGQIGPAGDEIMAGYVPRAIRWIAAELRGTTLTIIADTPFPLGFSTDWGAVQDEGVAVESDGGLASIASVSASGSSIVVELATLPTTNARACIGFHHGRVGLAANSAASTICDASPETFLFDGAVRSARHWAPAAVLKINVME